MLYPFSCHNGDLFTNTIQCFLLKVMASAEQSYSYYSGNDGTDKDPQVANYLCAKN